MFETMIDPKGSTCMSLSTDAPTPPWLHTPLSRREGEECKEGMMIMLAARPAATLVLPELAANTRIYHPDNTEKRPWGSADIRALRMAGLIATPLRRHKGAYGPIAALEPKRADRSYALELTDAGREALGRLAKWKRPSTAREGVGG